MRIPLLVLATVAIAALAWIAISGTLAGVGRPSMPALDPATLGPRVLVISPHPDDEALGPGGLTYDAVKAGRRVKVVVVTAGDGFTRIARSYASTKSALPPLLRLGQVRMGESERALAELGVPEDDRVFLGYPDGSMATLWTGDWDRTRPHVGKNGRKTVPYGFAYRPAAPYSGSSVASDLASIVESFSPSAVVYPDAEDANADHWAVNAFTQLTLDRLGFRGARYTYLVHRGGFPFPWSRLPQAWMTPPKTLLDLGAKWSTYRLAPDTERAKERALGAYVSQRKAMAPFLAAFVRRNELFATFSPTTAQEVTSSAALLAGTRMPGSVVLDPASDTLLRAFDAGADIRDVALATSADGVWLGIRANAAIANGIEYRVAVRTVGANGVTHRIDVEARGRVAATTLRLGPDSLTVPGKLPIVAQGARLWVRLPSSLFGDAHQAMLAGETYQGGVEFDRTAWRPVKLRGE